MNSDDIFIFDMWCLSLILFILYFSSNRSSLFDKILEKFPPMFILEELAREGIDFCMEHRIHSTNMTMNMDIHSLGRDAHDIDVLFIGFCLTLRTSVVFEDAIDNTFEENV